MADSGRSEILRRIKTALHERPRSSEIPRNYDRGRQADDPAILLAQRLADYRAIVHSVSELELPEKIASMLHKRHARTVAIPHDIPDSWRSAAVTWQVDHPHGERLTISELDAVDGVLTGARLAIAETGTIVLDGGEAQGRRMLTLVPDYHLCVLRVDQIVSAVPAALAQLRPTQPLTFVSGPSATSDIELDRVEGVHGPRTLEVVICAT